MKYKASQEHALNMTSVKWRSFCPAFDVLSNHNGTALTPYFHNYKMTMRHDDAIRCDDKTAVEQNQQAVIMTHLAIDSK